MPFVCEILYSLFWFYIYTIVINSVVVRLNITPIPVPKYCLRYIPKLNEFNFQVCTVRYASVLSEGLNPPPLPPARTFRGCQSINWASKFCRSKLAKLIVCCETSPFVRDYIIDFKGQPIVMLGTSGLKCLLSSKGFLADFSPPFLV